MQKRIINFEVAQQKDLDFAKNNKPLLAKIKFLESFKEINILFIKKNAKLFVDNGFLSTISKWYV